MNDDKMITQHDIDSASVRLRPILGVPPRQYLPLMYGVAILAVAFFTLVYPSIKQPGATWSFTVDPPGAAVYVDGAYRGYAPCSVFIGSGEHVVTIARPGFQPYKQPLISKGRLFGTLLVKARAELAISLDPLPGSFILEEGVRRFAAWALSGSPSEAYQIPMVLSDAARAASMTPESVNADGLAGAATSYSLHAQSFRDGIRAVTIAYGQSAALTPVSLARLVSKLGQELRDDPSMLTGLAAFTPAPLRTKLESMQAYRAVIAGIDAATVVPLNTGPASIVSGQEFIALKEGNAAIKTGSALSAVVPVASFLLASSETTVGQFGRFIEAHPEWAPAAAAVLVSKGLAEDDYLTGYGDSKADEVLTYVSKPAALAYCAWLTETAPAGYRFTLPSEAEWAYAASMSDASAGRNAIFSDLGASGPLDPNTLPRDTAGFKGLLGNVWEWCADSYSSNPASGRTGRIRFPSIESVVRGGSWANRSDLVSLASRGPMQESECSAYVGFRVALVAETGQ
ncbi:MAG: hypothetical protein A2Z96_01840 [Spirochaetes bacterium GWB1_48_6]|nr:MAG: hypothetical protein A2Z96_01840 [Spirochaetes bacterium GWB1_48_6]